MTGPLSSDYKRLVIALCEGTIAPGELQCLNDLLRDNPEVRRHYIEYVDSEALLRCWTASAEEAVEVAATPAPSSSSTPRAVSPVLGFLGGVVSFVSRPMVSSVLVAAVFAAWGLAMVGLWRVPEPRPREVAVVPGVAARVIGLTADCRWQEGATARPLQAPLQAGEQLQLAAGLVQVEFADGATVLLEGPATFAVLDAGSGSLERGKLTAQVVERAKGFAIETPAGRVVDLGTEFGVGVAPDGTADVHVFKGEVEVEPGEGSSGRRVVAGEAVQVSAATRKVASIQFGGMAFVRRFPKTEVVTQIFASLADAKLVDEDGDGRGDRVEPLALPSPVRPDKLRDRSGPRSITAVGEQNWDMPDREQLRYRILFELSAEERSRVLAADEIQLGLHLYKKHNPHGLRVEVHGLPHPESPSARVGDFEAPSELLVAGAFDEQTPEGTQKFLDVADFVKAQVAAGQDVIVFRLQAGPEALPNRDGVKNNFVFKTAHASRELARPVLRVVIPPPLRPEDEGPGR